MVEAWSKTRSLDLIWIEFSTLILLDDLAFRLSPPYGIDPANGMAWRSITEFETEKK